MGAAMRAWLLILGLSILGGCLEPDCVRDETRCEGGVLQRCNSHGGVYGPIDHPSHVEHSGPAWETVADCGANLCVVPASGKALCALDAQPSPACATAFLKINACDGTTAVTCREGYAIERRACSSCDPKYGTCADGVGQSCTNGACGGELVCNDAPSPSCEMSCTCPEGAACDAQCDASWSQAPDGGGSLEWTCQRGLCKFHY